MEAIFTSKLKYDTYVLFLGFWDESPPVQQQQQQQKQQPQQQQQQKKNKNNKKIKEENKVAAIFKESKGKPENEFEEWCISALEKLDPQVDIPTFLGFLNDVESPYEVPIYSLPTLSLKPNSGYTYYVEGGKNYMTHCDR